MIVSTYLDNGFFGGFYSKDKVPGNRNIATVDYENQFVIGKWDGEKWIEGASNEQKDIINKTLVPETISQMRLRKQLILSGISIQSIYDSIDQIADVTQRDLIYTMWEYAVVFERTDATLNQMASMLQISQEQLDQLFIEGNKL